MEDAKSCATAMSTVGGSEQPTKETGHDTSTPFDCHVINIGWVLPIVKLQCDKNRLKRSQDR